MKRLRAAVALTLLPVMAGGCVAAAIPVVTGAAAARAAAPSGKWKSRFHQRAKSDRLQLPPSTDARYVRPV